MLGKKQTETLPICVAGRQPREGWLSLTNADDFEPCLDQCAEDNNRERRDCESVPDGDVLSGSVKLQFRKSPPCIVECDPEQEECDKDDVDVQCTDKTWGKTTARLISRSR